MKEMTSSVSKMIDEELSCCVCCLSMFNVAFNNFSVIPRPCPVATGSSMLIFIVLPH